jgi:ubiquinone/menaquinone biosynthesis C-methylase UbiE
MEERQSAWDAEYGRKGVLWRGESQLPAELSGRVLELGCGDGKSMARAKGMDIVGVDISIVGLKLCAERLQDAHSLLQADSLHLPFADARFDSVLAFHILENLDDEEVKLLAKEAARVLRPGGHLWVRAFHPDDMRSPAQGGKGERAGISYHYRNEDDLPALLSPFRVVDMERGELRKRYHGRDLLRVVVQAKLTRD